MKRSTKPGENGPAKNGPRERVGGTPFERTTQPGECGPLGRQLGAPSVYDPHLHPWLTVELFAEGRTVYEVARDMGVLVSTVNSWISIHPEYAKAVKEGQMLSRAWWESKGRKSIHLPTGVKFQTGVYALMMTNRFKYKSAITDTRQKKDTTTTHKLQFDVEDLSTDELRVLHKVLGKLVASEEAGTPSRDRTSPDDTGSSGEPPTTVH
jgi:hypothetical protein